MLADRSVHAPPGKVRGGLALPALLLAGYATENYAKARLIELDPGKYVRDGRIDWGGSGHNLPWLVRGAGVETDGDEDALLLRLQRVVEWAGRYTVPLALAHREGEPSPRQASDADFRMLEGLWERLERPAEKR